MTVWYREVGKPGRVEFVDGGLESLQKLVGGHIEVATHIGDWMVIIANEEGICLNLPQNGPYKGNWFCIGVDGEEFRSLDPIEINFCRRCIG